MKPTTIINSFGKVLLCLMVIGLYSCNNNSPTSNGGGGNNGEEPTLTVKTADGNKAPSDINVDADAGDIEFTADATGDDWEYNISNGSDWLTEKKKTASSLTLNIAENKTEKKRSASLTFALVDHSSISQEVTITQAAGEKKNKAPKADLMDIVFNDDGTAKDVSPMNLTVKYVSNDHPVTIDHNSTLDRNVAHFNPKKLGMTFNKGEGSYYKIPYNADYLKKFNGGYSMELLVKTDRNYQSNTFPGRIFIFNTINGGGTGFIIQHKTDNDFNNAFIFQANLPKSQDKSHYKTDYTSVTPDNKTWYDLVGVWNKDKGKLIFYINGRKEEEKTAKGPVLKVPRKGSHWFCIGGQPKGEQKVNGVFAGKIAIARIYSKALSPKEVLALWNQVKDAN